MNELKKLEDTANSVLAELNNSYRNYNLLITQMIGTVDKEYTSTHALREAILKTISNSLHESGVKR